jgi:glutathione synthase/RimK-type ligase-like ATP-grasp enzyme
VISDQSGFTDAVSRAAANQVRLLAQELVPSGEQVRLLVFGDGVGAAQQIAEVDPVDLLGRPRWETARSLPVERMPEPPADLAVAAAKAMNYGLAGVHLMKNWTTSRWQVIDVSPTPLTDAGARSAEVDHAYARFLSMASRVPSTQ